MIVRFPTERLRAVWLYRAEFWAVGPNLEHLFADRTDASRFAQRVAANLNIPVWEEVA